MNKQIKCPECKGRGEVEMPPVYPPRRTEYTLTTCDHCGGTGKIHETRTARKATGNLRGIKAE